MPPSSQCYLSPPTPSRTLPPQNPAEFALIQEGRTQKERDVPLSPRPPLSPKKRSHLKFAEIFLFHKGRKEWEIFLDDGVQNLLPKKAKTCWKYFFSLSLSHRLPSFALRNASMIKEEKIFFFLLPFFLPLPSSHAATSHGRRRRKKAKISSDGCGWKKKKTFFRLKRKEKREHGKREKEKVKKPDYLSFFLPLAP